MRQFLDLLNKNSMLGIECLFRFPSREIKDSILSNYSDLRMNGGNQPARDHNDEEDEYQEQLPQRTKFEIEEEKQQRKRDEQQ